MSFNNKDMIYTKHCAVICLNQKYHLTSSGITKDGRCIFSTLIDTQNNNICNLITWYAPADYKERKILYDQILQLPIMYSPPTDLIILGDFNLHIGTKTTNNHTPFTSWLNSNFADVFQRDSGQELLYTFNRNTQTTRVDYIFCHNHIRTKLFNAQNHVIPENWSDHSLLSKDFHVNSNKLGPGAWRFNPTLLSQSGFKELLKEALDSFFSDIDLATTTSQEAWDKVKYIIQSVSRYYCHNKRKVRRRTIQLLEMKRQNMSPGPALMDLDAELEKLIETETSQLVLRSATRWQEHGEKSNKYFYRVIKERQHQQNCNLTRPGNGSTAEIQCSHHESRCRLLPETICKRRSGCTRYRKPHVQYSSRLYFGARKDRCFAEKANKCGDRGHHSAYTQRQESWLRRPTL